MADYTDYIGLAVEDVKKVTDAVVKELKCLPSVTPQEPCEDWYDVPSDEMTLEQARQAVKDLRKKLSEHLEQEPCEDAISRQAALDAMDALEKEDIEAYGCDIPEGFDGKRAKQAINALPPVNPQQRTGRLILLDNCSNAGYYCSECHKKVVKEGWSETVKRMNFCPNCGMPMESEDK